MKISQILESRDMCNVCGQTPCNCTHIMESTGSVGDTIRALYQQIYDQGDDALEYLNTQAPLFAQYWDQYEGDIESIVAELSPKNLIRIAQELKAVAGAEGLTEFAPPGGDDREPNEEEILRQLAAQWWSGTEQQMARAQQALEAMGWEIGPDESGDEDAGVYVYRIGDDDGRDTIAFGHSELSLDEGVAEGSEEVDTHGRTKAEWVEAVHAKYPMARVIHNKDNTQVMAVLPNGKEIRWIKDEGIIEQGVKEGADERKQNALWAQITAHEKAAKQSKDLKRQHHLKMADQLRSQLKTSDNEQGVAEGSDPFTDDAGKEQQKYASDTAAMAQGELANKMPRMLPTDREDPKMGMQESLSRIRNLAGLK